MLSLGKKTRKLYSPEKKKKSHYWQTNDLMMMIMMVIRARHTTDGN